MKFLKVEFESYVADSDGVVNNYIARVKGVDSATRKYLSQQTDFVGKNSGFVVSGRSFFKPTRKDIVQISGSFNKDTGMFDIDSLFPSYIIDRISTNIYEMMKTSLFESFTNLEVDRLESIFGQSIVHVFQKNKVLLKENGFNYNEKRLSQDWGKIKKLAYDYEIFKNLGADPTVVIDMLQEHLYKGLMATSVLSKNPYALRDYIPLKKLDEYAMKVCWSPNHPSRISGLISIAMSEGVNSGSTRLDNNDILSILNKQGVKLGKDEIEDIPIPGISFDSGYAYFENIKKIEEDAARYFVDYMCSFEVEDISYLTPAEDYLNQDQIIAVKASLSTKVAILTGGPGVGKTTVTKSIINMVRQHYGEHVSIKCIAPTGKAADKMRESTGEEAVTLHSALGSRVDTGFLGGIVSKMAADFVIIDEASMCDLYAFSKLVRSLNPKTRLLIIGDVDQLSSVEIGNVLKDLISTKLITTSYLNEPVRVDKDSGININAKLINKGVMPNLNHNASGDWHFIEENDDKEILNKMESLITNFIPKTLKIDLDNVQILSPQYETEVGVDNINKRLSKIFNPSGFEAKINNKTYSVGDRVMQNRTDKRLGLTNGSIGIIKHIDFKDSKSVRIDFDGIDKNIPLSKMGNLDICWAKTIHKSQGSEYDVVIIPLSNMNENMLNKMLLYTGTTRAKLHIFLIGSVSALRNAISNENQPVRTTALTSLIINATNRKMALNKSLSITNNKTKNNSQNQVLA